MVTTDEVSTSAVTDHSVTFSVLPEVRDYTQNVDKPSSPLKVENDPHISCSTRNADVLLQQHLPTDMDSLAVDLDDITMMETSSVSSDSAREYASGRKQPALNFHYMSTSEEEDEELDSSESDDTKRNNLGPEKTAKSRKVFHSLNKINQGSRFNRAHGSSALSVFARQRTQRAKLMTGLQARRKRKPNAQSVGKQDVWSIGELVWARPYRPNSLPWWPAVIVQRPRKPRAPGQLKGKVQLKKTQHHSLKTGISLEHQVSEYHVYLLGPLQLSNSILLPQTRLRLFTGRAEYDIFLRETVLEADDKVKALRQFVVPTNLQNAWLLARDTAEAMRAIKPEPTGRLSIFPWVNEARLDLLNTDRLKQQPPPARVFSKLAQQRAKKRARHQLRKGKGASSRVHSAYQSSSSDASDSSQSDSEAETMSDSDAESLYLLADPSMSPSCSTASADHQTTGRRGRRPAASQQHAATETETAVALSAKDLASCFEYDKLRSITTQTRRVFVCSVCGCPGEQPLNGGHGPASNTGGADAKSQENSAAAQTPLPTVMACAGGCGNYLHPDCGQQVECSAKVKGGPVPTASVIAVPADASAAPKVPGGCPAEATSDVQFDEPAVLDDGTGATPQAGDEAGGLASGSTGGGAGGSGGQQSANRLAYICSLCSSGLRQCFICNLTQKCSTLLRYQTATSTSSTENTAVSSIQQDPCVKESTDEAVQSPDDTQREPVTSTSRNSTVALVDTEAKDVGENQLLRCSVRSCSRWYHSECLRRPPFSALVRERRAAAFTCPAHACLTCAVENPGTLPRPAPRYVRCLLCPAAYHPGEWCFPAGSREIASNWIVCPRHVAHTESFPLSYAIPKELQVAKMSSALETMFRPTNVSWCFICSKGGRIICCETCPASFHEECLKIDEVPDKFICEDCSSGRYPRYGEIIWTRLPPHMNYFHNQSSRPDRLTGAKVGSLSTPSTTTALTAGMYWWPAEIVHPRHLPESANPAEHQRQVLGLFPTRLFGLTKPYGDSQLCLPVILWTTKARLFPYEEGDDKRKTNSSSESSGETSEGELEDLSPRDFAAGCRRRRRTQRQSLHRRQSTGRNVSSNEEDGEDEDPLLQISSPTDLPIGLLSPTSPKLAGGSARSPELASPSLHNTRQKRRHEGKGKASRVPRDPALIRRRREVYASAVGQAAIGWLGRREKFASLLGRTRRPDYYKPIKTNLPLGNVRIYRVTDPSEVPRCECKASGGNAGACGPTSNCINRELHYECSPAVCPNADKCQNQRFTKRLYPPQRPFWTGEQRGWGLKTLTAIQEGEFVNEYIGDLIDEEEANRRLRFAHENNVTNYYMMKLDSQRIIDAGPKGNLSRFMNHSCDPNLNTQKWTVNGDNRIGLFAVRDIVVGEELTFNYNFVSLGQERLNCRCGASNCVGFLGAPQSTPMTTASSCPVSGSTLGGPALGGSVSALSTAATTTTTSAGGATAALSSVDGSAEAISGLKGRRRLFCGALLAGSAAGDEKAVAAAATVLATGRAGAHQIVPTESASVPSARHETLCFRCHSTQVPADSHDTSSGSSQSVAPLASGQSGHEIIQGLDHERASPVVSASPGSEQSALDAKGKQSTPTAAGQHSGAKREGLVPASQVLSTDNAPHKPEMAYCCKPDCSKVYHLHCLDLKTVPLGRWYCPWHHCDACGRPSHVFCGLCPASFCLAHVEGSVTVLPPVRTRRQLFSLRSAKESTAVVVARVVCLSHTDLISADQGEGARRDRLASQRRRLPGQSHSHVHSTDLRRCSVGTDLSPLRRVVAAEGSG